MARSPGYQGGATKDDAPDDCCGAHVELEDYRANSVEVLGVPGVGASGPYLYYSAEAGVYRLY